MSKNEEGFTLSCKTHSSENSTFPPQGALRVRAFTLAEVLLTLAIIGVVAALAIPAVITKVTQDQYVTGLKKAYRTLKAVQREAEQEHGPMENWNWTGNAKTTFEKYFKPHFDILKDCGATTEEGCFSTDRTNLDGNPWTENFNTASYYRMVTSDGISFLYRKRTNNPPARQGEFYVDVNGLKDPNKMGRDIFEFNIFPSDLGIKPRGSYSYLGNVPLSASDVDANCNISGIIMDGGNTNVGSFCSTKVLTEGAMNY